MRSLLSCILLIALLGTTDTWAQGVGKSDSIERQVKAAYLYKFASYVEWPEEVFSGAGNPLVIGVIGADALANELEQIIAGHTVNGRAIITRKLKRGDPLSGLHILFIGHAEKDSLNDILSEAKKHPVLTVTDSEQAHAMGSMINFVITGERLRFEVALTAVELGRLKISARMLTAAYKVKAGSS